MKWDDFEGHTAKAFQTARDSGDFSDVTLVCEDGHLLDAHKLVLSASSQFFQDVFKMNNHPHPLIYLRGVKAHDLMALVDFLYHGETKMSQEHVETFLAIAEDLQIKGLVGGCGENIVPKGASGEMLNVMNTNQKQNVKTESKTIQAANDDDVEEKIPTFDKQEKKSGSKISKNGRSSLLVEADLAASYSSDALEDLDAKVNSFIQLVSSEEDGLQRLNICTVCNKIGHKTQIKDHIEAKHFEGISIVCNHCGHTFRTRSALRHHTKKLHQDLKE